MVTQCQTFCASLKQEEKIWGYANHKSQCHLEEEEKEGKRQNRYEGLGDTERKRERDRARNTMVQEYGCGTPNPGL